MQLVSWEKQNDKAILNVIDINCRKLICINRKPNLLNL
jgi:hypothetical protein